jgi:hypothetical protein
MPDRRILSIDCDLHHIFGWMNKDTWFNYEGTDAINQALTFAIDCYPDTVLLEVASPVSALRGMTQNRGVGFNLGKWMIYNIAFATEMALRFNAALLVAPSNVWTKGYPLKVRHELAGCTAKKKDLRECEAMQFFYRKEPDAWVSFPQFVRSL